MPLPQDPLMLMSVINTYLRDQYSSLEDLCEDQDLNAEELKAKLETMGFTYQPQLNQFR